MKQQKMTGYWPAYPRKALRGAALTGLALVTMGGCRQAKLQTSGIVAMPEPTEEVLVLDGEVGICEPDPTEEPALAGKVLVTEPPEEELVLDGEVGISEPEPTPDPQELTTTGMVYVPEDDDQH